MSIKRFQKNDIENYGKRIEVFQILMLLSCIVILARLWYLQIIEGNNFKKEADNNRIRTIPEEAVRGNIFDRNGVPLAFNQPSFTAQIVLEDIPKKVDKKELLEKICNILDISS